MTRGGSPSGFATSTRSRAHRVGAGREGRGPSTRCASTRGSPRPAAAAPLAARFLAYATLARDATAWATLSRSSYVAWRRRQGATRFSAGTAGPPMRSWVRECAARFLSWSMPVGAGGDERVACHLAASGWPQRALRPNIWWLPPLMRRTNRRQQRSPVRRADEIQTCCSNANGLVRKFSRLLRLLCWPPLVAPCPSDGPRGPPRGILCCRSCG